MRKLFCTLALVFVFVFAAAPLPTQIEAEPERMLSISEVNCGGAAWFILPAAWAMPPEC